MRIPLQQIEHKESSYERPNQYWVCGWARDGNPCKLGPDERGKCTVAAQSICDPTKQGDRWVCTRADISGGPCENGPSPTGECACPTPEQRPCQPRRSLRALRGRLSIAAALFSSAILLIVMMGPNSLHLVSPGELSAAHLAIEGPPGEPNCSSCHKDVKPGISNWFMMIAEKDAAHSFETSQQCLACHFSDQEADTALSIHSNNLKFASDSEQAGKNSDLVVTGESPVFGRNSLLLSLSSTVHGDPALNEGTLPCSRCHNEHEGAMYNISSMNDIQCQVCHSEQFESFNVGHPAFTFAESISNGIVFDHAKHQTRLQAGLDCMGCHTADVQGKTMIVQPFEVSCQGCHEQRSIDHHGDVIKKNPIPFLQLPELEFEDPEYWPVDYAVGEALTPMMTLLLAGDDNALPLIAEIFDEDNAAGDLYEWSYLLEEEDQLYKKAELATAIKQLVAELSDESKEGSENRKARLARAFSVSVDNPDLLALHEELSSADFVIQMFKNQLFPKLEDDLAGDEPDFADIGEVSENMFHDRASGWRLELGEAAISYRAVSHSDNWLKTWIEILHSGELVSGGDEDTEEARMMIRSVMYDELKGDFRACLKCHMIDHDSSPGPSWHSAGRSFAESGYAKFDHRPHMAILNEPDNCLNCHRPTGKEVDSSKGVTPRGFLPNDNQVCGTCHAPGKADNSCLTCHDYHHSRP